MKREYTREEVIERIRKFATGQQDPHAAYKSFWDEVLEELEQEPCDDAVSREKVKKIVDFYTEQYDGIFHVNESIDKLPSVTQKSGKWIPVSERLPEDAQEVLYSTKTGCVFHGEYYDDNTDRKWFSYKDDIFSFNNVVNAWMPLPEPYEPQESEE